MEDEELWGLFAKVAQAFLRAQVPDTVASALRLRRMTALRKDDSAKMRGIVAGAVLRRVSTRAVVMQFGEGLMAATEPFQFALQTHAGTEALAHLCRYLTDADPDTVVVSLDGIGAFDHVQRAAFMTELAEDPNLLPLLPLVGMLYGSQSRFFWTDDAGVTHTILQGEGGEQGDPLMPALFALAQHGGLAAASRELQGGDRVLSFLDDLYVLTTRSRAWSAFQTVATAVEQHAGVQTHMGKLKVWCRGGGPHPRTCNKGRQTLGWLTSQRPRTVW